MMSYLAIKVIKISAFAKSSFDTSKGLSNFLLKD